MNTLPSRQIRMLSQHPFLIRGILERQEARKLRRFVWRHFWRKLGDWLTAALLVVAMLIGVGALAALLVVWMMWIGEWL